MNEIERIKKEGWLSKEFWNEEVCCDCFVTRETKELWAILLDIYKEFARICDKHGLEYFGNGGTVLGAVRHKGFIPWDDDIDILMPRSSYNKLVELSSEFLHPYFLQTNETDPEYGYSYMRIHNLNTAVYGGCFSYTNFKHCICIDIMPLDKALSLEEYIERRDEVESLVMKNAAYMRLPLPDKSEHDNEVIAKYLDISMSQSDVLKKIDDICSRYNDQNTPYLCQITPSMGYRPERKFWRKEVFDGYTLMPVEGMLMRMPKEWDEYLTVHFSDYMKLPPEDLRVGHVGEDVCTTMSYKEYFKKKYNIILD